MPPENRWIMSRAQDYWRIASPMLAYGALGVFGFAILAQFYGAMAPRLWHLGTAGMKISDWPCGCPQCDFSGFWPAGLLAREGRPSDVYNPAFFLAARHAIFSPQAELVRWFYPPPAFLPAIAISYVPFESAFWLWTFGSIAVAVGLLRYSGLSWAVIAASITSPAVLWNTELGQFGTITGAAVIASIALLQRAPIIAGIVLGMLVIKPQCALLVPFVFAATLNLRAIAASIATALTICAAITWQLGYAVWTSYFSIGLAVSKMVLEAKFPAAGYEKFGVSVFWMLRNLGVGIVASYIAQAVCAAVCIALVVLVWRCGNLPANARIAITILLSLLVPPYGYTDDMVAYSVVVASMAAASRWRIDLVDVLFWIWPALCPIVFLRTGILLTPLIVLAAAARVYMRTSRLPPGMPQMIP